MHERRQCKHGILVSTCRCIKTDKKVTIVACPARCKEKDNG